MLLVCAHQNHEPLKVLYFDPMRPIKFLGYKPQKSLMIGRLGLDATCWTKNLSCSSSNGMLFM